MDSHGFLVNAAIYLLATVVAVPISRKLGMGVVLGYLGAGVVIGPWTLGIISNVEDILHFAEFGVVLLLFMIGLELNPKRLWSMRKPILGVGGAQLLCTALLFFAIAFFVKLEWKTALLASLGLSLSSTAIVLQILSEKKLLSTPAGATSFSILLFQDIAVLPIMAMIPLLGISEGAVDGRHPLLTVLMVVAVITSIIVGGRYLTRPVFRIIANTGMREVFTAFTLLLVIGTAWLMQAVGMSMALGTFLAGVLLAESEYRHELESNIEPFKGLLLGLFFTSVGMSIDFGIVWNTPLLVLTMVAGLVATKMVVLFLIGRLFRIPASQNSLFSFVLSQGGEFAFVIFGLAVSFSAMNSDIAALLTVVVALSMATTPLLMIINTRWIEPRFTRLSEKAEVQQEEIEAQDNQVIIAGFGRFGQVVGRLLHANKIETTIIDNNPDHIEYVRKFGFRVFYGDVSRSDLLYAAGADKARLFILAIDDWQTMIETINTIQKHFPTLTILARARDKIQAYELMNLGVTIFVRETFNSALQLGELVLCHLGYGAYQAKQSAHKFSVHDSTLLYELYHVYQDEEKMISHSRKAKEDLERIFEADEAALSSTKDTDWG
ncbi:MAG: glutathione-regulated potassium-efflux system protein KefC [Thermodesulfobacteriota bacterium]